MALLNEGGGHAEVGSHFAAHHDTRQAAAAKRRSRQVVTQLKVPFCWDEPHCVSVEEGGRESVNNVLYDHEVYR